jgi:hypothetical protein
MKRLCFALAAVVLLLLVAGVGTATASPPATQDAGQLAGSDQDAGAAAGTAQQEPTNESSSVRVLSPGDDGDVSQSNEATSDATAVNQNATEQSADQTQSGSGLQAIGQSAENQQDALAVAATLQEGAANENRPVRVLAPGDGGDVTQTNTASSDATAANLNGTEQTADQTQSGDSCCKGDGGEQLIGQSADSEQSAEAKAATVQEEPTNSNISVRVLSPGDNGAVTQTNEASSDATAVNKNGTEQSASQDQSGDSCCKGDGGEQAIAQSADSDQQAVALAGTVQEKPKNSNISVRVLSSGDDGPVTQTNTASSNAEAVNLNGTQQAADQSQASGSGSQLIGQSADNDQKALAGALTVQKDPSNENISVRVLSPGGNGSVTQSNVASSNATAANVNYTGQTADQMQSGDSCKCKSDGTQLIGQKADSEQDAKALAGTFQVKPSNSNTPVRVLSKGDDGDVSQTNEATSDATAANLNATKQTATQAQGGGSGLQAIGQSAKNDQDAFALALTAQIGASNENKPVRILSKGDGGDVTQSNVASSDADAVNWNGTEQSAAQKQAGDSCKCGSGEQLIGQSAKSEQEAAAVAATFQLKPSNSNHPIRVLSKGDDGSVEQSNEATSDAQAVNLNGTKQTADQVQGGGSGLQAIGQSAKNAQGAFALGLTFQLGASNENAPVRVLSKGDGGDVTQSNVASSNAQAVNANWTAQHAGQLQGGTRGCCAGGIQAIGQLAENHQGAIALAATVQLGAKQPCVCGKKDSIGNSNAPTRVKSPGDDGSVDQSNLARSTAAATNWNAAKQTALEIQAAPCVCKQPAIQAIGQLDKSSQFAASLGLALQLDSKNSWKPDRKKSPGDFGDLHQVGKKVGHDGVGNWSGSEQMSKKVER